MFDICMTIYIVGVLLAMLVLTIAFVYIIWNKVVTANRDNTQEVAENEFHND